MSLSASFAQRGLNRFYLPIWVYRSPFFYWGYWDTLLITSMDDMLPTGTASSRAADSAADSALLPVVEQHHLQVTHLESPARKAFVMASATDVFRSRRFDVRDDPIRSRK